MKDEGTEAWILLNQFQTWKGSVPVKFATGKITLWLGWRGSKFIVIATVKFCLWAGSVGVSTVESSD